MIWFMFVECKWHFNNSGMCCMPIGIRLSDKEQIWAAVTFSKNVHIYFRAHSQKIGKSKILEVVESKKKTHGPTQDD